VVKWKADIQPRISSEKGAALQKNGNFILYDNVGTVWSSETCANCTGVGGATPPPYYVLYLPGDTSSCPCKVYMCIVVDLPSGGKDYYYAVNDGEAFNKTLASC
jgi:hypothetical protein